MVSEDRKEGYREAYDAWQRQLQNLHEVLLEGKRLDSPVQLKGLLNRESRAKRKYDLARLRLLGIEEEGPFDDGEDDADE